MSKTSRLKVKVEILVLETKSRSRTALPPCSVAVHGFHGNEKDALHCARSRARSRS